MKKIRAELSTGSTTLKAAVTTGCLSLLIAALPISVGIFHTRISQTHAATWIPTLAVLYARYVSAAAEPFWLVMVGWGMTLFSFLVRSAVRKGTHARAELECPGLQAKGNLPAF